MIDFETTCYNGLTWLMFCIGVAVMITLFAVNATRWYVELQPYL